MKLLCLCLRTLPGLLGKRSPSHGSRAPAGSDAGGGGRYRHQGGPQRPAERRRWPSLPTSLALPLAEINKHVFNNKRPRLRRLDPRRRDGRAARARPRCCLAPRPPPPAPFPQGLAPRQQPCVCSSAINTDLPNPSPGHLGHARVRAPCLHSGAFARSLFVDGAGK